METMKKAWKGVLAASLACTAMLGAPGTASAGYELNPEVKAPTPALRHAAQLGVLRHETPELQSLANKDAILVMSFGTTYKETRAATIDATVAAIQAAHPDTKVVCAFTSHIIVDRIKANEGISIPTPEEALEQLKKEGYTRVAMATLDILPGMEYAYNAAVFHAYKDQFKAMTLGTPVLYWMGQEEQRDDVEAFVEALKTELPKLGKKDAVLLMAHGTPHPANAYYPVLQTRVDRDADLRDKAFVYTVEGWPRLGDVIPELKKRGVKHVTLVPVMMVCGDHATNDMAGDEPDSHKSVLEAEGYKVSAYLHGLGENKAVRAMFAARADEAWDALAGK